ncbi:hypothetical protein EPA93_05665 [Ktedonosporobacter rubrisoli]|uniref:Beta-glucuronidase C-terminal domain-containing protein n=1 Tax=Ktedonosporobacter rubrisoli TaxID=2509675 RepID=A0A4P6JK23_KTERU|nr:glycosyl hydrolase family 79 C-terminal domain-containing protein [Ktedonosporobacter rubrisoli]QBD75517.1 hypothetical protein EPA93_05665 [Ktedonosporobacter rubrisoli]
MLKFCQKYLNLRIFTWMLTLLLLMPVLIDISPVPIFADSPRDKASAGAIASKPIKVPDLAPARPAQGDPINIVVGNMQNPAGKNEQTEEANLSGPDSLTGGYKRVRPGFASLSLETYHVCNFLLDSNQAKMKNIIKNLGPGGTIRIGGASLEATGWDSKSTRPCPKAELEDTATVTPLMIQKLLEFAHSIGWKVIWGVSLHMTPEQAAEEALTTLQLAEQIGQDGNSPLLAIAIGNEPEIDMPVGTTYSQFRATWEAEYNKIKASASHAVIEGPDTCCTENDQWFTNFMQDEGGKIQIAANHLYPTNAKDHPTIGTILSPELRQEMIDWIDRLHSASSAQGLPLQLAETNSMADSPIPEVGKALGQSLWTADYLFFALEHGAVGLNFHGGIRGDATSPMHGDAHSLVVQATYYGMLFFRQATTSGGYSIPVQAPPVSDSFNLAVHAIHGRDGKLYVALVNKGAQGYKLQVVSGRPYLQAQCLRLQAPSVDNQDQITVAGAGIRDDGSWSASQIEQLPVTDGMAFVTVPAYSAALLTFA